MAFRKLLLRVMLWSLALAAVCGVLAVLFSGQETAWRVVGTMMVTAVAAGLMMWMSALSEKERTRKAGFLGMTVVVAEWMLGEFLIWDVRSWLGWGWGIEERLGMTMFFGAVTTLWAMLALGCRRRPGFALASTCGLAIAGVVAALWLAGTWWPTYGPYGSIGNVGGQLLESAGAAGVLGVLGSLVLVGFSVRRWWVWIALLCATAALAMWLTAVWYEIRESNGTVECLIAVATVGAFWSLLRGVRLPDQQQWTVWSTMAAAAVTGLLVGVLIVLDKQNADVDLIGRLAAAGAILTGCGTLAILVLGRLNRHDIVPAEIPTVTDVAIICPICAKKQKLPIGESKCGGCGLLFEIKVKEPRCPQCNYLLFMLKADRCPECGMVLERTQDGTTDTP